MGIAILVIVVLIGGLIVGIQIGFMIGFSCAMREAAKKLYGTRGNIAGRILCIVGSLSLVVALCMTLYSWHFTHVAQHASGTVIEMREQKDKDGAVSHAPTFRFQDSTGIEHTVSSSFFQEPPAFHVGESVPILYLGDDPETARIDSFWQVWGLPSLIGIESIVALAIGLTLTFWPKIVRRFKGQTACACAGQTHPAPNP
jgi:hypothetical protein